MVGSWWPFTLDPPRVVVNDAQMHGDGAWTFSGAGLARSDGPVGWNQLIPSADAVMLKVRFRASDLEQTGPARLVHIGRPDGGGTDPATQNIVIGQVGNRLELRVRRSEPARPIQARMVTNRITAHRLHHLRLSLTDRLEAELDGQRIADIALDPGWADAWLTDAEVALGNAPGGGRPWSGDLLVARLAIDDVAVDLLDPRGVETPGRYLLVPSRLTQGSDRNPAGEISVWAAHLLSGAALGFTLRWSRPVTEPRRLAVIGLAIVLVLNLVKVLIATRHPSLTTVLLQSIGVFTGQASYLRVAPNVARFGPRHRQREDT